MSRMIAAGLLLLAAPFFQVEPTAHYTAEHRQPLIGEPLEIELTVIVPAGSQIIAWPDFVTSWTEVDIAQTGELMIHDTGSHLEYQQTLTVRFWEPGDFETPNTVISYQSPDSAVPVEIVPEPLLLTIPSVLTGDETLRGLKSQVSLPYVPPVPVIFLLAIIINLGVFVVDRWRSRRASRVTMTPASDIRLLDKKMLAILKRLDQQQINPAAVYNAVSGVLRDYTFCTYGVSGHEMTTSELMETLVDQLSDRQFHLLGQLLTQADLVKFAKVQPGYDSARRFIEVAAKWLHTAEMETTDFSGEAA